MQGAIKFSPVASFNTKSILGGNSGIVGSLRSHKILGSVEIKRLSVSLFACFRVPSTKKPRGKVLIKYIGETSWAMRGILEK